MILSFHPNIVAHENLLCAGRLPDERDEEAVRRAEAIILPQGCSEALYRLCRRYCSQVFPNYDCRFDFPGKLGQASLFQLQEAPFPETYLFPSVDAYMAKWGAKSPLDPPLVFKSNWGGEGEEVFLVESDVTLKDRLARAAVQEQGGRSGFLLQEYIPTGGRDLRVVVMGHRMFSYWRVQQDIERFQTNLGTGGVIDSQFAPELQERGKAAVAAFCGETKIDLAGFDLLFPAGEFQRDPVFLEINYFFGRRGLGGSFKYYELLDETVNRWLAERGLGL